MQNFLLQCRKKLWKWAIIQASIYHKPIAICMNAAIIRQHRQANQIRPICITPHFMPHAEGSVLIECGNTKVICTASVEEGVPGFLRGQGLGWVTAEYGMLPRSTHSRMRREAAAGKQSGRTQEIQRLIGRSLRAVVDRSKLGERQILIDCDVIAADGGTRTASITGAFVAMQLAINGLLAKGLIAENPIIEAIAAVSVGVVDGVALLDLDYPEDSGCDSDVNVVMTQSGKIVEVQGTAEGATFSINELNELLQLAQSGINELLEHQQRALQSQAA